MIKKKRDVLYIEKSGSFTILSPDVGVFETTIRSGDILSPGSQVGNLTVLGSRTRLHLPGHISGTVDYRGNNQLIFPVGFKNPIFILRPDEEISAAVLDKEHSGNADKSNIDEIVITAFSTGIFYIRPSPDSDPFISTGSVIQRGSVLGLIEVMKSFNQIVFTGDGKYERGRVKRIVEEDSSEVSMGDPLFIISVDKGGKN